MSQTSSRRRTVQKAQGTFEGATARKVREAREAAERAKVAADKAVETTRAAVAS